MFLTPQTYKGLVMTIKSFPETAWYLLENRVEYVLSKTFVQCSVFQCSRGQTKVFPPEAHVGRHRSLSSRSEIQTCTHLDTKKTHQQRIMVMIIQPEGKVEKRKIREERVIATNSPQKKIKARKQQSALHVDFDKIYYSRQSYSTPLSDSSRINLLRCWREGLTEQIQGLILT